MSPVVLLHGMRATLLMGTVFQRDTSFCPPRAVSNITVPGCQMASPQVPTPVDWWWLPGCEVLAGLICHICQAP